MRIQMLLIAVLLVSSALVMGKADSLDELIDETSIKHLMLDSNGKLLVIEGTFLTPAPELEPIRNTRIKVYCQHGEDKNKIFVVKTDDNGDFFEYKLNMQTWKCDEGDKAWGEYDKDTKRTAEYTIIAKNYIGVDYIGNGQASGVPEFPVWGLGLAVVGSTLGIVAIRRKGDES